ncbi:MAG: hypothetical protein O7C75_12220 [Verrucomicrobia bacterium]|nr:hypothetical protein [Verrucomicrobiota bacterium]
MSKPIMNAIEIIEEISRLPVEEKGKVIEFIRQLPNEETIAAINEPSKGLPRYRTMEEVKGAIKDLVNDA